MFHVEVAPLGGILGPLKSDLGVFWLYFGSFFAWSYNVKTQKTRFLQNRSTEMAKTENMHYTICLQLIYSSGQIGLPPTFASLEQRGVQATTGIPNYSSYCGWPPDDHLQEAGPSRSSFASGWHLWMIICRRPAPLDHHLQEAGPSGWPFGRGRSLWIIICKRPAPSDNHLQEAGPSELPFTRGRSLRIIICKRPAPHIDNHKKGMKKAFLSPFTIR